LRSQSRIGLIAILPALTFAPLPGADVPPPDEASHSRLLLGTAYPIDVSVSFHKALLHWLDSLTALTGAGFTAGKTIEAHRREYEKLIGRLSPEDQSMLRRYHGVRLRYVEQADIAQRDDLTLAFFETPNLASALERAGKLLDASAAEHLSAALLHFEPYYRRIWREGRVPEGFVRRAKRFERRTELERFLLGVAHFLGVPAGRERPPQLVLVPVPSGFGTHAQAIGSRLLIEIRSGESLREEVAPIVHENVHFLFQRIPSPRLAELERVALAAKPWGRDAWRHLKEALPTAIAQGIAEQAYGRPAWSMKQRIRQTDLSAGQEGARHGTIVR
jgi:hypothetical protein